MAQYGTAEYWEERYSNDSSPYDWYQTLVALQPTIEEHIPKDAAILYIGSGTSTLAEEMVQIGYQNIKCIDRSTAAVSALSERTASISQIKVEEGDIFTFTEQPADQFDAIIDKALLDTAFCGPDSYDHVDQMLKGISHVLKPGGVFIEVTFGGVQDRMEYLNKPEYGWSVSSKILPRPEVGNPAPSPEGVTDGHKLFICKK
ncbi:putative kinase domain protein [Blattamonas nauphoetae]|uniref:Kinase domain protein n=1 Tax=Blattamonas nauphoetae TaxID=2049346 RepID=A0ABQ9XMB4_9EUKA|nr:putative kinase domain protein [Blattamonas nauphoetae]